MTWTSIADELLQDLVEYYDEYRPGTGVAPERYVVCAGLAILEHMREKYPLEQSDYLTPKNQVRTSGAMIRNILERFGETRTYASEGARTTRGTRPAAESLVKRLNSPKHEHRLVLLSRDQREQIIDILQGWLVGRVREYFDQQHLTIAIDLRKSIPRIIGDIISAARQRNAAGPVAQHLVGAKLAIRFPCLIIDNYSYTTSDEQLGRPGDFVINDSVFHVTVAPSAGLASKCGDNIRNGYQVVLLTPEDRLAAAYQLTQIEGLEDQVCVLSVEGFVGQNLDELIEYKRGSLVTGLKALLEEYNHRVGAVEADPSLLIDIPHGW